jgi:asparagine synthase (glutamine-hydrolysing)
MSGLAGLVVLDGHPVARDTLDRMARATPYRPTDGIHIWHNDQAGLIHFSYATTPEALQAIQPLRDAHSGDVICFDGRLDNRRELFHRLRQDAVLDDTAADCVLVLALFNLYGTDCLQYLIGDYALAIWQPEARRLFCARSPLGWRPFQWYCDEHIFAFASEIKTLIDGLKIVRRLNEAALGEFLAMHFTTSTETFWRDVYRLAPGGALLVENGRLRSWHWHTGPFLDVSDLSQEAQIDRFRTLFDQAIAACVRSSTTVASHLSGGLDSSSIVCRAIELYRTGAIDTLIRPISARFPEEPHDESEWSSAVEDHLGIEAMHVIPERYNWDWARSWCAETFHLPLRPNVLGPIIATCQRLQAEGIRVLLTGEGGDDWMNGSLAHWPDLLRQARLRQLWHEGMHRGGQRSFVRNLLGVIRHSAVPWLSRHSRRQLLRPHFDCSYAVPEWIRPEWARHIGLADRWQSLMPSVRFKNFAQQQRYARYDLARHYINFDNVLAFAASRGVELRHPLHDLRLTTFFMGVSGEMLQRNGQRKYLLRAALRGTLPEKVRTRQTKANFTAPIVEAMSRMFAEQDVDQLLCVQMGWMDGHRLAQYIAASRAWFEIRRTTAVPQIPLGAVWSALAADLWLRHAFGL